jgi:peptide/nickel transport system permease protein
MLRFLCRRLVFAVVLIVCASSAALLLTRLAPGDVTTELGAFAPEREVEATRERFGLDRSPFVQLGAWARRAVRFDFGESFLYNQAVGPLVARAALNTLMLALVALAVATALGLSLGILTGTRDGPIPSMLRTLSLVVVSMPPLLLSLGLVFLAARTGWVPTGGMASVDAMDMSWGRWLANVALHLPLPALALALPMAASFERLQSQSIAETLEQPFVAAAAARGLSRRDLVLRHAWRVSLAPICGVYGIAIGALLSGSFIVEYVTAWPGLGRLMYDALRARDIYLVAGCATAGAAFLAVGTLIGDLLMAAADPRTTEG